MQQTLFQISKNKIYEIVRGQVINNVDPNKKGACQIRWMPYFQGLTTTDIPWSIPAMPLFDGAGQIITNGTRTDGTGEVDIPKNNTMLWGWFENGDVYQPVYFAEAPDMVNGIPNAVTTNYPNTKVKKTSGGYQEILNDTTGDNTFTIVRDWILNVGRNFTVTVVNLASIIDVTGQRLCQSGFIQAYAGSSAPNGWLLCYGQSYSTTQYPQLFNVIGYTYGGSGGNFNVPDYRGRVPAGLDNMGGTDAMNLYESQNSMTDNRTTLGGVIGEAAHTQTIPELVPHTHSVPEGAPSGDQLSLGNNANNFAASQTTGSTGGGLAFNVVQPGLMCNYIIKI